jgi:ribonuclease BN (tRNA processing enzyme)
LPKAQTGAASAKTALILLGTQGGPNVSLTRSQAASVVMAGGQPYLVDCGYGTVRALVEAGIRVNDVRNTFLTHLHNDHKGGFGRAAVSRMLSFAKIVSVL